MAWHSKAVGSDYRYGGALGSPVLEYRQRTTFGRIEVQQQPDDVSFSRCSFSIPVVERGVVFYRSLRAAEVVGVGVGPAALVRQGEACSGSGHVDG